MPFGMAKTSRSCFNETNLHMLEKKVQTYLIYWQCMVDTVDGQNPAPLGAGFFHQLSNWLGSWVVRDRTAIKSELGSILLATAKYV